MRDHIRSATFAALAAACALSAQTATAQSGKVTTGVSEGILAAAPALAPTAEQVFARHVQAIGGKEAVLKTTAIRSIGRMEMPAQGISGLMESAAAENRTTMKLSIPGIGDITNGFDGEVAWELNPMSGPRIKNDKEKVAAQEDSDFRASMLFVRERYASVEVVGPESFAGENTWQVRSVLKSGRVVNEFFSVTTGLRVGSETTSESQSGVVSVSTRESEYKQFGAIKVATRKEMTTGAQKVVVTISDVVLGTLPDSAFALPAAVKALVKP